MIFQKHVSGISLPAWFPKTCIGISLPVCFSFSQLTPFRPIFLLQTPWKYQKTKGYKMGTLATNRIIKLTVVTYLQAQKKPTQGCVTNSELKNDLQVSYQSAYKLKYWVKSYDLYNCIFKIILWKSLDLFRNLLHTKTQKRKFLLDNLKTRATYTGQKLVNVH